MRSSIAVSLNILNVSFSPTILTRMYSIETDPVLTSGRRHTSRAGCTQWDPTPQSEFMNENRGETKASPRTPNSRHSLDGEHGGPRPRVQNTETGHTSPGPRRALRAVGAGQRPDEPWEEADGLFLTFWAGTWVRLVRESSVRSFLPVLFPRAVITQVPIWKQGRGMNTV